MHSPKLQTRDRRGTEEAQPPHIYTHGSSRLAGPEPRLLVSALPGAQVKLSLAQHPSFPSVKWPQAAPRQHYALAPFFSDHSPQREDTAFLFLPGVLAAPCIQTFVWTAPSPWMTHLPPLHLVNSTLPTHLSSDTASSRKPSLVYYSPRLPCIPVPAPC